MTYNRIEDRIYKQDRAAQFMHRWALNREPKKPAGNIRPVPWKGYEGLVKELKR